MSTKCRNILFFLCGCTIILLISFICFLLKHGGAFQPYFALKGESSITMSYQDEYQEKGYIARSKFQNKSNEVKVTTKQIKPNEYQILYTFQQKRLVRHITMIDDVKPNITLKGAKEVTLFEGEAYHEQGVKAYDEIDGDVTKQVKITSNVKKEVGIYQVTYQVSDQANNQSECIRKVRVVKDPTHMKLHYQHDAYDNTYEEWWFEKSVNHQRNKGAKDETFLAQYQAYYQGKKAKVIYLTFDEGGNDVTYIKEIAKVLDQHDIKASFFLTANYLRSEANWVKEMVRRGHHILNHTAHHKDMSQLAHQNRVNEFVSEILSWEKDYIQIVGKASPKYFRFPKGGFSERSLKMVSDLGYRSIFWSHAYYDYGANISKKEALDTLLTHVHPGAIYLIHPSNKGNYEAMEDFIIQLQKQGYRFALLDDLV